MEPLPPPRALTLRVTPGTFPHAMPAAPHIPKRAAANPQRALSKTVSPNGRQPKSTRASRPAPELIFGDLWEYDPAPETADPKLKARYDLFINGQFTAPKGGRYFDSINPANEQKLAEIALAGAADVDAAFQAARRAYDNVWSRMLGASGRSISFASRGCSRIGRGSLPWRRRSTA